MRDARSLAVARSHFSRVTARDLILREISATEIAVICASITKYSLLLKIRELPAHNTAYMACSRRMAQTGHRAHEAIQFTEKRKDNA